MFDRKGIKLTAKSIVKSNMLWSALALLLTGLLPMLPNIIISFISGSGLLLNVGKAAQDIQSGYPPEAVMGTLFYNGGNILLVLITNILSIVVTVFFALPLMVGYNKFLLNNKEGETNIFEYLFQPFKEKTFVKLGFTMAIQNILIGLLTMLCVIPGFIFGIKWMFVPFIIAENPELSWKEASARSKEITSGHFGDLFVLLLSFIGWFYLSTLCTCGILGIVFVYPYLSQSIAQAYKELSGFDTNYNNNQNIPDNSDNSNNNYNNAYEQNNSYTQQNYQQTPQQSYEQQPFGQGYEQQQQYPQQGYQQQSMPQEYSQQASTQQEMSQGYNYPQLYPQQQEYYQQQGYPQQPIQQETQQNYPQQQPQMPQGYSQYPQQQYPQQEYPQYPQYPQYPNNYPQQ